MSPMEIGFPGDRYSELISNDARLKSFRGWAADVTKIEKLLHPVETSKSPNFLAGTSWRRI